MENFQRKKTNRYSLGNSATVGFFVGLILGFILRLFTKHNTRDTRIVNNISFPDNTPDVQLPELDVMRNIPILRFLSTKKNKYLWALAFSWILFFIPGMVISGINGTLFSISGAAKLIHFLPNELNNLFYSIILTTKANPKISFFDDTGLVILLGILFPLFTTAELSFYPLFGPMVKQLHSEEIHIHLLDKEIYLNTIQRYDRKFNNIFTNIFSVLIGVIPIILLFKVRSNICWWGNATLASTIYVYIIGTYVCYQLFGIGTFKGWAAVKFCLEFFNSDTVVLNLHPCHPDDSAGLGILGRLLTSVYWGALISALSLFAVYKFNVFQNWTWVSAILVIFGVVDYSIFVTIPTFMVYKQASISRRQHLETIGKRIRYCLQNLDMQEIWESDFANLRRMYLDELGQLHMHWKLYKDEPILPFSIRQITVGAVFYCAQLAQIIVLLRAL